jgi:hypothetical protein
LQTFLQHQILGSSRKAAFRKSADIAFAAIGFAYFDPMSLSDNILLLLLGVAFQDFLSSINCETLSRETPSIWRRPKPELIQQDTSKEWAMTT